MMQSVVRRMKRLFFIALLVMIGGPAYADWTSLLTDENANETFYVDSDSLRRKGIIVKIWTLIDKKMEQQLNGSTQMLQQLDCEEETFQFLAVYYRSGMGEGEAVHSVTGAGTWEHIPPYSPAHLLQIKVCKQ